MKEKKKKRSGSLFLSPLPLSVQTHSVFHHAETIGCCWQRMQASASLHLGSSPGPRQKTGHIWPWTPYPTPGYSP